MADPRRGNITILCDASLSVTNWVATVLRAIPVSLREVVVFKLTQALLQVRLPRSQVSIKHIQLLSGSRTELVVGRDSYHVSVAPGPHHLCGCKATLRRKRRPILVVPGYAIQRAHRLLQLADIRNDVLIASLETMFVVGIVFEAARRGRTIPDMWEGLISEYNREVQDGSRLGITLEWRTKK